MREIKFRVWDKENKEMVSVTTIDFNEGKITEVNTETYCWSNNFENSNLHLIELMQYTSLKDKNGKEIYEGDIINNEGTRQKYEVIFHKGCFCINRSVLGYHIFNENKVEVIGNIYENPELIK